MKCVVDRWISIFVISAVLMFAGCRQSSPNQEIANTAEQWLGHQIAIPDNLVFQVRNDTVAVDIDDCDFKILTYVDSSGCTSCRLQLQRWAAVMRDFNKENSIKVNLVMVIQPKAGLDIGKFLRRERFRLPVVIDTCGMMESVIPEKSEFRTMLLSRDNKVLALGNPALNPRMKEFYSDIMRMELQNAEKLTEQPDIRLSTASIDLGTVVGNTAQAVVSLINNRREKLELKEIAPSCDCVSYDIESMTVPPMDSLQVKVNVSKETAGDFYRTITFVSDSLPSLELEIYGIFAD